MAATTLQELDDLIAAEADWLAEKEVAWQRIKRRFGSLVIQFSGLAFICLLALMFLKSSDIFVAFFALMMATCTGMICLCASDREHAQRWLDWHAQMRADPDAWPWPPTPASTGYVAEFGGAPR